MFHRRPSALGQLAPNMSVSLAQMSGLEGFSRSLLVGVVPLLALEALGSKEAITQLYFWAAILTMSITLNIGLLERLIHRRWVVTMGGTFLILGALFLYMGWPQLFAAGIGLRAAAASVFSVCLSLYILDYIGKQDLTRSESRRMQYSGLAWLTGPILGVWLWENTPSITPFLLSATAAVAMLVYFWRLRLGNHQVIRSAQSPAGNPIKAVPRYFKQPRLRIAYSITLSRACYWAALFIYAPIYVIEAGLPTWVAGGILSGVSALMFGSPLVRMLADRFGTRQIIVAGLLITGVSMIGLGWVGEPRPIGTLFWFTGAIGGVMLDVLGSIPFLRLVKPRERTDMTLVFSTWREGSELLTPVLVAAVLLVAPFYAFYFLLACMHFAASWNALKLPKRL